jgi:DNA polymerase-1
MVRSVGFDLETASADDIWRYGPEFVRLCGSITDGKPLITTNPQELIDELESADWVYAHNFFGFDGLALAYYHGMDWERIAAKALDTLILSRLDYPPEARSTGVSKDRYDLTTCCERKGIRGT